jgi:hypothetical protein
MDFRIADTFTNSLGQLTGDEQKAVKTTAFDLQLNPASPGLQFHKLDKAKDKNFWSVRVNADIRLIVHKTSASFLLCYVDHHDDAYAWAERRKLETHPKTGAAQLVEIRERVQEIVVPTYIEVETPRPKKLQQPLFHRLSDEELLNYGVPNEWLADVRAATEDSLFGLADHLPAEAAEALLELSTGGKPRAPQPVETTADPFAHPDALRRFRVMSNTEELARALDYPWDKWTVFLHPDQRQWVVREYSGPARVSGSAGTGKTIVALHRAAHLARANADARVLLTTFSDTLANALRVRLTKLVEGEPRLAERVEVYSLPAIARRLYRSLVGPLSIIDPDTLLGTLREASHATGGHKFSDQFLISEWDQVVDAWQLSTWEAYRDVARLGRKTRLPEPQRQTLWAIFDKTRADLGTRGVITEATMYAALADAIERGKRSPYEFVVVDEAQDLSVSQLRFLAALGGQRPDALFFAGDLGQRIFQQPFSWKSLGIDLRGRSRTLRVNYRTSHQIRVQADRLLGPSVSDVDGITEERDETVSVFNGPPPTIRVYEDEDTETQAVSDWLAAQLTSGVQLHEIAIFVRSRDQLDRAQGAAERVGAKSRVLDDGVEITTGHLAICTMHLAKGLEFRAVAVMACDDEVVPLQQRIETVGDEADLQEVYDTERHLLYVACTRARDALLVTAVEPGSEFLDDLQS